MTRKFDQSRPPTRRRPPIPNFSTMMVSSSSERQPASATKNKDAAASENSASMSIQPKMKKDSSIIIEPSWLVQLETSLVMYFTQHQTTTHQISYREFCRTICHKLALSEPQVQKNHRPDLTQAQRLWHDLVCVATPSLYKVQQLQGGGTAGGSVNHTQPSIVLVQTNMNKKNRMQELRRLMDMAQEKHLFSTSSQEAMQWIEKAECFLLKEEKEKSSSSNSNQTQQQTLSATSVLLESSASSKKTNNTAPVITPDMTIDQRVQARAQHKLDSTSQREIAKFPSRDVLEAAANALWAHARGILRRSKSGIKKSSTAPKTESNIIFRDVCQSIQMNTAERYDKKQWTLILNKLQEQVPQFVKIHNPNDDGQKKKVLAKTATIFIETKDFKITQALLRGETPPPAPETPSGSPLSMATTTTTTLMKTPKDAVSQRNATAAARAVTVSGNKRSSSESLLSTTEQQQQQQQQPATKKGFLANILDAAAAKKTSSRLDYSSSSSNVKRPLEEELLQQSGGQATTEGRQQQHASKRLKQDEDEDSYEKKKKPKLRINPDFILTDDDWTGGSAMQPSLDLPRGLRRLFLQMNEGRRI